MKRYTTRPKRTNRAVLPSNVSNFASRATLKDLCEQDKDRVKKLVEDLAIVGTEKEEIDEIRKKEKYEYEMKLYNLQKKQAKLAEENKNLEESLKTYKEQLEQLEKHKYQPTEYSTVASTCMQPSVINAPTLANLPALCEPHPFPASHTVSNHQQSIGTNPLKTFTTTPLLPTHPYLHAPFTQHYQLFPSSTSSRHPPLTASSVYQQQPIVHNQQIPSYLDTPQYHMSSHPSATEHSVKDKLCTNTTWCTLPETDQTDTVNNSIQLVHSRGLNLSKKSLGHSPLDVESEVECYKQSRNSLASANLANDIEFKNAVINQSTPPSFSEEKAVQKETVSTQTEVFDGEQYSTPAAAGSAPHHQPGPDKTNSPNKVTSRPFNSFIHENQVRLNSIKVQTSLTGECNVLLPNWELAAVDSTEEELVSEILNQTTDSLEISGLEGLSISLIDFEENKNSCSVCQDDDENLIKDIFYI